MSDALRLAPTRASARNSEVRDLVMSTGKFDADIWHVMEQRDDALVADEILNGAGSSSFLYKIDFGSTPVIAISVVGARHLAWHYGGLKHRMVASVAKIGSLFRYTSYPIDGARMQVSAEVIFELANEPDFYQSVVEVSDVKRGNTIQIERSENRLEYKRTGEAYERPNYATIASSKAYRNAVLTLIPQDVQLKWKEQQIQAGKSETITGSVLDEKRASVLRFAAAKGIPVDRRQLDELLMDQISGLSDAARAGGLEQFTASAEALGLVVRETKPTATVANIARGPGRPRGPAPPVETQRAAPAAKEPEPPPVPFEAYLADEHGEVQADPDGTPIGYSDPLRYARALAHSWHTSKNREAVSQHNADGIADARARSAAAAVILDALVIEPDAEPMLVTMPRTPKGSPHVPNYRAALIARLATVKTEEGMIEFAAANRESIVSLPQTGRLQCVAAVAARCAELGITTPVFEPAPDPSQAPPSEDADIKRAAQMRADMDACESGDDLEVYSKLAATVTILARLERDRPELAAELREYAKARRATIRGG